MCSEDMTLTQLYWDNFADEVVTEIDAIAPPERYVRVHCGSDVFIEQWFVGDDRYLDVAYTVFDRKVNGFLLVRDCLKIETLSL